ncbi:MAG: hypothetical protein IJS39_09320 [Synergistaceae bacterium]|nr:hypothetical protein [Synergistaceae bacterium]
MLWLNKLKAYVMKLIKPSMYISGMDYVFKLWSDSDTKERGILLLTFSPMFVSMGGVIFTIIYFVLFVLPSYVFSIFGWGMLTAIFGAGGKYCFKYFTGKEIKPPKTAKNVIDVDFVESSEDPESDSESESEDLEAESEAEAPRKRTSRKKPDAQ